MKDRPVMESTRRAALYGALAIAGVAGIALAAAAIVSPGGAPLAVKQAETVTVAEAADAVQDASMRSSDAPASRDSESDEEVLAAANVKDDATSSPREKDERADAPMPHPATSEPVDEQAAARPLNAGDPRFGDAAPSGAATASTQDDPMAAALSARAANARSGLPESSSAYVDDAVTSAIAAPARVSPADVEIAETEAEIVALEAAMAEGANASDPSFVIEDAIADEDEMVPARIRRYVNLRGAPSNDAEVFTVVASDTRIRSQPLTACGHFCAVEVDGQAGFIGKSFIAFDQDS